MPSALTPRLLARLLRRRPRARREPEPADMGTCFGMEQWLDERESAVPVVVAAAPVRRRWLARWMPFASAR